MAHHDFEFLPRTVAYGSSSGPETLADIITTTSGYRHTNRLWDQYLRRLSLSFNARTPSNAGIVLKVFELVGVTDSFLQRDHGDWNTTDGDMRLRDDAGLGAITKDDQPLRNTVTETLLGDGSTKTFQMTKRRVQNTASHTRLIYKPQATSPVPLIAIAGVLKSDPGDYSFSATTGIVTFTVAPGNGVASTWGGAFFIPVMFMTSRLQQQIAAIDIHQILSLDLTEIRGV